MKSLKGFIWFSLTLLLALLESSLVSAQTVVSGDILTNTIWNAAGSPYQVTGNVRVVAGVTLQINAGAVVSFDAQTQMDIEGQLNVTGNALDSVLFHTSVSSPDTGSWAGIWIHGSVGGAADISYAKIAYASTAVGLVGSATGNSLVLDHSEIRHCSQGLSGWQGSQNTVRNCGFKENHTAVIASDLAYRRCAFAANTRGIVDGNSDIDSCTFTKHLGPALEGGGGNVRGSLFVLNTIGLLYYGFSPTDSVNGCQFAENDTAAVATGSGSTFFGNEFCANTVNVRVDGAQDVAFSGNCWCSIDTTFIATTFVDGRTNASLGLVTIAPIDTNCQVITQVWPGDANDDGAATIVDALYLGVAYGSDGPRRSDATASWSGQSGLPWDLTFDSGLNYKHADCDGDGYVDQNDTLPIVQNFGQTHYKMSSTSTHGGIPVIFELPLSAAPGDTVEMTVKLGDAQHPAVGVYGLAFVLRPDTQFVRPAMQGNLNGTWLGSPGVDLMDLDVQDGRFHWAVVRNNQQSVTGNGRMGGVTLVMIDDLTRWISMDSAITVEDVALIDKKGNLLPIDVEVRFILPGAGQVTVYPTIANGRFHVALDTLEADAIELYDQNGQLAFREAGSLSGSVEIDTRHLLPGMYFVRVILPNGILNRKVFVMR